jgi:cation transport ATPase
MEENTGIPQPDENPNNQGNRANHGRRRHKQPRPVLLTFLCIFSLVFYGLTSVLLFILMFFTGWIAESDFRNRFLPDWVDSKQMIILVFAVASVLHLFSLIGTVKMWNRRKSGYLMFSISTLAIALFQLFTDRISIFTTAVYILFILLFGYYYRRFH